MDESDGAEQIPEGGLKEETGELVRASGSKVISKAKGQKKHGRTKEKEPKRTKDKKKGRKRRSLVD